MIRTRASVKVIDFPGVATMVLVKPARQMSQSGTVNVIGKGRPRCPTPTRIAAQCRAVDRL
ncbi:MAG: hypothetical protein LC799_24855 [Actinobacteria bacterium]|nr:hypothetical protein [Actinomycetota bacterium]